MEFTMTYHHQLARRAEALGHEPRNDTEIQDWFWAVLPERFPAAMQWLHQRTALFLRQPQSFQQWDFPVASTLGRELEKILGVDLLRTLLHQRLGLHLQYAAHGQLQVTETPESLPPLDLASINVSKLLTAHPEAAAELQALAREAQQNPTAVAGRSYQPNLSIARGMATLLTVITQRQAIGQHLGCTIGWLHCCDIQATVAGTITPTWQAQYASQRLLHPSISC